MNVIFKDALAGLAAFFHDKIRRRLVFLGLLGLFALTDFLVSGLVRRTFVFYPINDGTMVVEDRMLKRSSSRELDIGRYVEEALLGPVSPDMAPLFPGETRLRSLLYRNGVVYIDLSEDAALPLPEGGLFRSFSALYEGIRRNFSFVKDVRFFINGKAAYFEEFNRIFTAENEK
jgi:spore germination protein GerM